MAEILGAATAATKLFLEVNYVFLIRCVTAWNQLVQTRFIKFKKFRFLVRNVHKGLKVHQI